MPKIALLFLLAGCVTSNHPGAIAYRHYDWRLGDSGNSQYRVWRYGDSPPGVWIDADGRQWRKIDNEFVPLNRKP